MVVFSVLHASRALQGTLLWTFQRGSPRVCVIGDCQERNLSGLLSSRWFQMAKAHYLCQVEVNLTRLKQDPNGKPRAPDARECIQDYGALAYKEPCRQTRRTLQFGSLKLWTRGRKFKALPLPLPRSSCRAELWTLGKPSFEDLKEISRRDGRVAILRQCDGLTLKISAFWTLPPPTATGICPQTCYFAATSSFARL